MGLATEGALGSLASALVWLEVCPWKDGLPLARAAWKRLTASLASFSAALRRCLSVSSATGSSGSAAGSAVGAEVSAGTVFFIV